MTFPSVLTIRNLTYTRGGMPLIRDLSLKLCSGELAVLMGPNGSGKTTLLKCIAGIPELLPNIEKAREITQSYVGHLNALKAHCTIYQNLLRQTKATSQEIRNLISHKGLLSLDNQPIQNLSVGQRRQVALMRPVLSKADLWLIDEPTTHLDEHATIQFWNTLENHLAAGGSAVITSHAPVPIPSSKIVRLDG
jgi:heme exporter protein A